MSIKDFPTIRKSSKRHLFMSYFCIYLQQHYTDYLVVGLEVCKLSFSLTEDAFILEKHLQKYLIYFISACDCLKCAKISAFVEQRKQRFTPFARVVIRSYIQHVTMFFYLNMFHHNHCFYELH